MITEPGTAWGELFGLFIGSALISVLIMAIGSLVWLALMLVVLP